MATDAASPELMQALAKLGLLPQHMGLANASIKRGQDLADTPMPQGQVYEPGYQAPHPLEYVASMLRRAKGEQMSQQGTAQATGLLGEAANTNRLLAEQALGGGVSPSVASGQSSAQQDPGLFPTRNLPGLYIGNDPADAAAWPDKHPDETFPTRNLPGLYIGNDPVAAAAWPDQQPTSQKGAAIQGPDQPASTPAGLYIGNDPAAAAAWPNQPPSQPPAQPQQAGVPNVYDLLMGSGPDAAAVARAMSEQIRRGRQIEILGALGSPNAAMGIGKAMGGNADQDIKLLERAAEARMKAGEEAKQRDAALKAAAAERAYQAQAAAAERKAALQQTIALINANKPQAVATPNTEGQSALAWDAATQSWVGVGPGDRGRAGGKGTPGNYKTYSKAEITDYEKANDLLTSVKMLGETFDPSYAGKGLGGDLAMSGKQLLGSSASKKVQAEANYWKQLQLLVTNPQRHALFGSALSAHEKAAWDAANALTPKSSPEVVRKALLDLQRAIDERITAHGMGRVKEGYDPEATEQYIRASSFKAHAPGPAPSNSDPLGLFGGK